MNPKLKMLFSICQFSIIHYLQSFSKYIAGYWFMASSAKEKIYDFEILKTLKEVDSPEFSPHHKIVTDSFPRSLGTNQKIVFLWI